MKKYIGFVFLAMIIIFAVSNTYSEEKKAQTGFEFLSVGADARAVAMGEAFTTMESHSCALFYNPAGMARLNTYFDVSANHTGWIADITHYAVSLAIRPALGKYGVFGVSMVGVDYGEIQGTMVYGNAKGYVDTEIFEPKAYAIGIGYAIPLTDRFAVGGQIKHVGQQLGKSIVEEKGVIRNLASGFAFDLGTIYRTGFKSFNFGMSVRNFSEELKYQKEGFQLPLTFKIGMSIDALDIFMDSHSAHSVLIAVDASHPRSGPEFVNAGAEYLFMNMFALRCGYVSRQSEYGVNMGFGLQTFGLSLNYSYTPFGVFDAVNRFTVGFAL